MDIISQINSLDFITILQTLWIRFKKHWHVLHLYDNWKLTDGWKADLNKGIVSDFSNKWRPQWDRISLIEAFFSISRKEAVKWYAENFWLQSDRKNMSEQIKPLEDKWNSLWELTQEQIDYLSSRRINYSSLKWIVKNYNWRIAVPIRGWQWQIKSIQSRTIKEDDNVRYMLERNTDWDGIFFDSLDTSKRAIVVVEWFTDYLSLRQFTTNVVGLVNAKNDEQINYIKKLSETFKIFFVPDNDEAWETTIEKFKEKWIRANTFNLKNYASKDINEMMNNFWLWIEVLDTIFNDSEKPLSNMQIALNRAKEYKQLYKENNWHLWFSTWYKLIDKFTDWFIKGKTYLLMAFSNQWKTRFAYSLIRNMISLKKKVHFYSLEIDTWMLFLELMWAIEQKTKQEVIETLDRINLSWIEEHIEVYDEIRSLEAIEQNIKNEKPDVAFIDFLQNVECKWTEYEKMTEIALRIQKLAILTGTTIISLSQVSNESRFSEWSEMSPKGSWALFASSDVIFSLWGRDWSKYFSIAKNKFWPAGIDLDLVPNYATSSFWLMEIEGGSAKPANDNFNKFKK